MSVTQSGLTSNKNHNILIPGAGAGGGAGMFAALQTIAELEPGHRDSNYDLVGSGHCCPGTGVMTRIPAEQQTDSLYIVSSVRRLAPSKHVLIAFHLVVLRHQFICQGLLGHAVVFKRPPSRQKETV